MRIMFESGAAGSRHRMPTPDRLGTPAPHEPGTIAAPCSSDAVNRDALAASAACAPASSLAAVNAASSTMAMERPSLTQAAAIPKPVPVRTNRHGFRAVFMLAAAPVGGQGS